MILVLVVLGGDRGRGAEDEPRHQDRRDDETERTSHPAHLHLSSMGSVIPARVDTSGRAGRFRGECLMGGPRLGDDGGAIGRHRTAARRTAIVAGLDYGRFEALTFDCYGTLIDWETGILAGLRPMLARGGIARPDDELLADYAELEAAAEAGPYRRYREILHDAPARAGRSLWRRTGRGGGRRVRRFGRRLAGVPRFDRGARAACTSASAWASSPTATTTCSPDRPSASATDVRLGRDRRRRPGATSRASTTSRSRSSGSGSRASGSSTSPRASTTTT